jgi:hypothetical protein
MKGLWDTPDFRAHFPHQREPVVLIADFRETGWKNSNWRVKVPVPIPEAEILTSREYAYRVTPQLPFCESK